MLSLLSEDGAVPFVFMNFAVYHRIEMYNSDSAETFGLGRSG